MVSNYMRWYLWVTQTPLMEWYRDDAVSRFVCSSEYRADGWWEMRFFSYEIWRN